MTSNGDSKKEPAAADSTSKDVSVSEALKDSSGVETTSIYDRYKAVEPAAENTAAEVPVDTSAADAESFQ